MGNQPNKELLLAHKELQDAIFATLRRVDPTSEPS
jgi:hypothetical protein